LSQAHRRILTCGVCGCGCEYASCVAPPACDGQEKKTLPFLCHLIQSAQGLQTICAACPLLISSSFQRYPVCPRRPHVLNRTGPAPDRRRSRLKSSSPATLILDHSRSQPQPGYFPALFISQALAITPLMFQRWSRTSYCVPGIALTPHLVLRAEDWVRHLLLRPGRSLPRRPCNDMELGSGCMRAGERNPRNSCQTHPAICPTLPVLETLLHGAEKPSLDDRGPRQ
jgi:hypothetical protein